LQLDMGSVAVYPQNAKLRACCSASDFKVRHTINSCTRSEPASEKLSVHIRISDVAHLEAPVQVHVGLVFGFCLIQSPLLSKQR
jgi:hypothetical protein